METIRGVAAAVQISEAAITVGQEDYTAANFAPPAKSRINNPAFPAQD